MMGVTLRVGDIFQSEAQTLVNTVNCVGVMGKGIALEFKRRFPAMFSDYEAQCRQGLVQLGRPYLYRPVVPPWILNFPTKDHWRSVSRVADIVAGLEYLLGQYKGWGIESIAVPPLGCGQGQLEWGIVGPTLFEYLSRMSIPVELYAPWDAPEEQLHPEYLSRRHTAGTVPVGALTGHNRASAWVAIVEILRRIGEEQYHWPVGRVRFQKIAYVATIEGLPTGIDFRRGSYGPFSEDLKGVHTWLINNGLVTETRQGRMLEVRPGPAFKAAAQQHRTHLDTWEPLIGKVSDLFMRVSTDGAEAVATVLFAARELAQGRETGRPSECEVLAAVMDWKQRRRPPLEETQIAATIRELGARDWLSVEPCAALPLPTEDF